ncbi:uncharacterized protein [Hetaerina americana]|uniref:uncharacterized protein isoform X1 n=1 Tax=Hetaerina americana TaxID=62018 RepID=UPI003A7F3933
MGFFRSRAPLLLALACFVVAALSSPIPEDNAPEAVRESLETLDWETPSHDQGERNKRTIGFLRNLFPGISEIIDRKLQSLTRVIFQLVGRLVLGGGGGGSRTSSSSSTGSSDGSRRISITLPTFPPDLDEETEDEAQTDTPQESTLPSEEENFAGSESRVNEVRVPFESNKFEEDEEDQEAEATGDEASPSVARSEDSSAESDNAAAASDANADRDKRFLFFGGNGESGSGGSAGGSGNFLFDIIRLITGSGSAEGGSADSSSGGGDGGAYASFSASVGGDGASGGAAAGAVGAPSPSDPNDGYTSGIPGPLTRLFIIANRGISNLLQDLILRLSQTSERIVNFKARLITALI